MRRKLCKFTMTTRWNWMCTCRKWHQSLKRNIETLTKAVDSKETNISFINEALALESHSGAKWIKFLRALVKQRFLHWKCIRPSAFFIEFYFFCFVKSGKSNLVLFADCVIANCATENLSDIYPLSKLIHRWRNSVLTCTANTQYHANISMAWHQTGHTLCYAWIMWIGGCVFFFLALPFTHIAIVFNQKY